MNGNVRYYFSYILTVIKKNPEYQSDVVFSTVVSHEEVDSWFESTGLLGPSCVVSGYSSFLPQICMGSVNWYF